MHFDAGVVDQMIRRLLLLRARMLPAKSRLIENSKDWNIGMAAEKARDCREAARRARSFVDWIGSDVDGMYLRFAKEQERQATELEAQAQREDRHVH